MLQPFQTCSKNLVGVTFSVGGGPRISPFIPVSGSSRSDRGLDIVPLPSCVSRDRDEGGLTRGVGHKVMGAQRAPQSHLYAEDPKVLEE